MTVWAGVLAAGEGRRMGSRPKALLEYRRKPFLEVIAETARAAGVDGVAVVIGHHAPRVEPIAAEVCDIVVVNPAPDRGMGSSARTLAKALPDGAAMLLWPVDIPHVSSQTVKHIIAASVERQGRLIIPVYNDRGHPPLLPARAVESLRSLPDDARLDVFLESLELSPVLLEVSDPAVEHDVDSPADLRALVD